jgi:serine/threonine protein kinase
MRQPFTRRAARAGFFRWGLKRFHAEARTLARFSHPGIVQVIEIFQANGTAYLVMDYQNGTGLMDLLEKEGPIPEQRLRGLLDGILEALEYIHNARVLHRDVKPANIIVLKNGHPVLIDFGNARHAIGGKTQSLAAAISPGYSPSEQYILHGRQGPWTDIYALGATLYHAICGKPPPEAPERAIVDTMIPAEEAGKDRYDQLLLKAIDRALSISPTDRPQNIAQFRDLLGPPDTSFTATAGKAPSVQRGGPTIVPYRYSMSFWRRLMNWLGGHRW